MLTYYISPSFTTIVKALLIFVALTVISEEDSFNAISDSFTSVPHFKIDPVT